VPGHEADENEALAVFTGGGIGAPLREALRDRGLPLVTVEDMPLLQG
jgi:glutamate racemase